MKKQKCVEHNACKKITLAQLVEAILLLFFAVIIAEVTLSGRYTLFTTPRAYYYLLITAILLFILSICAAIGWFSVSSRDVWRMFVAFVVPALLIIVPLRYAQNISVDGFDQYAGGRAIAIRSQNYPLSGLYEKSHEITVDDDDFGSWYDEIDHNAAKYDGYAITLTGFVSRDSTLNANQFRVSRQLMSCCILDMSPFGLVAEKSNIGEIQDHEWVRVRARVSRGNIGIPGYQHPGVVLHVISMQTAQAPTGYFYRP